MDALSTADDQRVAEGFHHRLDAAPGATGNCCSYSAPRIQDASSDTDHPGILLLFPISAAHRVPLRAGHSLFPVRIGEPAVCEVANWRSTRFALASATLLTRCISMKTPVIGIVVAWAHRLGSISDATKATTAVPS